MSHDKDMSIQEYIIPLNWPTGGFLDWRSDTVISGSGTTRTAKVVCNNVASWQKGSLGQEWDVAP
ncbi:hypothetical protein K449DRAFT_384861 [Hypoxylon sp. EC38]|nr:hypothetical protein K449DRAFT_384861 [Hypoxylon sp. EC38]